MKPFKKLLLMGAASLLALPLFSFAGGPEKAQPAPSQFVFRGSAAFGPRVVDDQVMRPSAWDTVLRLSMSGLWNCGNHPCRFGLMVGANTAWSARFNSVNNPTSTTAGPVLVHNSASLDFLLVFGWNWSQCGVELGFGPQVSWVKWLNSVQQATSGVRVAPKLRLAVTHMIAHHTQIFLAASQAFNPYGKLKCTPLSFNCFDDCGYVSVTDLTIGISEYI